MQRAEPHHNVILQSWWSMNVLAIDSQVISHHGLCSWNSSLTSVDLSLQVLEQEKILVILSIDKACKNHSHHSLGKSRDSLACIRDLHWGRHSQSSWSLSLWQSSRENGAWPSEQSRLAESVGKSNDILTSCIRPVSGRANLPWRSARPSGISIFFLDWFPAMDTLRGERQEQLELLQYFSKWG